MRIAFLFVLPWFLGVSLSSSEEQETAARSVKDQPDEPPLFVARAGDKEGFIDAKGSLVIPATFQKAYPFKGGLAAVQMDDRWGFIDTHGEMVIRPQFTQIGSFSEGLAPFRKPYRELWGAWGYIDRKGKVVIEPRFDTAEDFRGGVARVGLETARGKALAFVADARLVPLRYRFIDRTGAYVKDPCPARFATGKPGGLILFEEDERWGFCDSEGKVVIEPKFVAATDFSEGLACARLDDLYGFIDKKGEFVIKPQFPYPNSFAYGLAGVPLGDNGWGFIDKKGKVAIEPQFAWIYGGFRHGLAEVALNGKQAYVDKKGRVVWPAQGESLDRNNTAR